MDLFDTFPKCSNSRQSEVEMRDVIISGGGYARQEGQDPSVDDTAQKVQQEPNPIHTSIENMDMLAESSAYSCLETSRSSAFENGFEMTPNFNSVQQKEIMGDENNEENTDILDVSLEYSFLETSRSNALGDGFETTLNVKSVEQKEIVGVENNEVNMDFFLDESLEYSFLETSRSNAFGNGFETTLNVKSVEQKEIMEDENNEENMDFLDESFFETSRSNAHGDGPETPNVMCVEQQEIMWDENFGRTSAETSIPASDLSGLETSRSSAHGDGPETPNAKRVEHKDIMGDENNERTPAEARIRASEFSGLETSRSNVHGDGPDTKNVECVEQKEIMADENNGRTSAETRNLASELSELDTSRFDAHGNGPETPNVERVAQKEITVDENNERTSAATRIPASELYGLETSRSDAHRGVPETPNVKCVEQKEVTVDKNNEGTSAETRIAASELSGLEKVEELCKDVALHSDGKSLSLVQEDAASNTSSEDAGLLHDQGATFLTTDYQGADATGNLDIKQSESVQSETVNIAADVGIDGATPVQSKKRKSVLVSPENTRVLRSRSQEKAKLSEPTAVKTEDGADEKRKVKRERKKEMKNLPVNEFSRIRKHLRYLLQRINFEQSFIDAYSGEGWKGQSLEKIKPEKELQRARCQIFSCKMKIRDLFQCLDASLNQGKLPETLFDSEGEIDSDDIFCAKCGTVDVTLDNDIILCDGVCDRGFHQFCLEPPLLKKDIPLDDEGWLCPGCDCKDDCFDILNDFQGSRLSILDNWEKVFPEEAAAKASGKNMDDISSLPSEDSDDDNYSPDNQHQRRKASGDDSSGKSDYNTVLNVKIPGQNDRGLLELPSDDSEDDDFDPIAPSDDDQPAEHESSSSDFTSDSEDLGAVLEENSVDKDEGCISSLSNYTKPDSRDGKEKPTVGKAKGQSLSNELSYLIDSDATAISGKRHVARLDYKKLHDETYGDATSDSSDEEYGEKMGRKRRKDSDGIATPGSVRRKLARKCHTDARVGNDCLKEIEQALDVEGLHTNSEAQGPENACGSDIEGFHTSFEPQGPKNACGSDVEGRNTSSEAQGRKNSYVKEKSSGVGSSSRGRKLEEAATQRLLESFKENQYPNKDVKDSLAKELGLRVQQVDKWFGNARWSFRNTHRMESKMAKISGKNDTALSAPKSNESNTLKLEPATESTTPPSCNKVEETKPLQSSPEKVITEGSTTLNSRILRCRKKNNAGNQSGGDASTIEPTTNQDMPVVDTPTGRRKSTRLQKRSSS